MAVNQVLQIFDIKSVTGVSGPPSGFAKIWPDSNSNPKDFKITFDNGDTKSVLRTFEVNTDVFDLSTTTLDTTKSNKLDLKIGRGLSYSSTDNLFVNGLTTSSLAQLNTFTAGYVLSASTQSGEFFWVPNPEVNGDLNYISKFSTTGFENSLMISTGSNVYIGSAPNVTSASFSVSGSGQFDKIHLGPLLTNFIENNNGIKLSTNNNFEMIYDNGLVSSNILTFNPVSNFGSMSLFGGTLRFGNTPSNYLNVGFTNSQVSSRFFGTIQTDNLVSTGASISIATFSTLNVTTLGTFSSLTIGGFTATTVNDITTFGGVISSTESKLVSSGRHFHKYNDIVSTTSSFTGLTLSFTNEFLTINPATGSLISITSITGSAPGRQVSLRINSQEQALTRSYNYIGNQIICGTAINGMVTISGFTMTNSIGNFISTGFTANSIVFLGTQSYQVGTVSSTTQMRLTTTASVLTPNVAILAGAIEPSIALNDVLRVGNFLVRVTGFSAIGGITYSFTVDSTNLTYYNQIIYRSNLFTVSSAGITITNFGQFVPGYVNRLYVLCEDQNSVNIYYTSNYNF